MRRVVLVITLATSGLLTGCNVKEKLETQQKAQADADFIMNNLNQSNIVEKFPPKYFPRKPMQSFLGHLAKKYDFTSKRGKFVDVVPISDKGKDQAAFIYEYILNRDSLRFIYSYNLDQKEPELFSFTIEPIQEPNSLIIDPKKQLRNSSTK